MISHGWQLTDQCACGGILTKKYTKKGIAAKIHVYPKRNQFRVLGKALQHANNLELTLSEYDKEVSA